MSKAKFTEGPELHAVKAWSANAIAFIEAEGLTRQFSDWCGGWPCPVSPEMVHAAPELLEALVHAEAIINRADVASWLATHNPVEFSNALELVDGMRAAIAKALGNA